MLKSGYFVGKLGRFWYEILFVKRWIPTGASLTWVLTIRYEMLRSYLKYSLLCILVPYDLKYSVILIIPNIQ